MLGIFYQIFLKKVGSIHAEMMSCITVIDFWLGQIWILIQYWHINALFFRERYAPFVFHLKFFHGCKIARKGSKAEFMQKSVISCISVIDFWRTKEFV